MSNYYTLKNAALLNPSVESELGSFTDSFGNLYLTANISVDDQTVLEDLLVRPRIVGLDYPKEAMAANIGGGETCTIRGEGFKSGIQIKIANVAVNSVAVIDSTRITFVTPAKNQGNYLLTLLNTDGGVTAYIPGIDYSPTPAFSTSNASPIVSDYEKKSVSTQINLVERDIPQLLSIISGALAPGLTLESNGRITGTLDSIATNTSYQANIAAVDYQNQVTYRLYTTEILADACAINYPGNGSAYSYTDGNNVGISVGGSSTSGRPVTISVTGLPTGLSYSNGVISGTLNVGNSSIQTFNATISVSLVVGGVTIATGTSISISIEVLVKQELMGIYSLTGDSSSRRKLRVLIQESPKVYAYVTRPESLIIPTGSDVAGGSMTNRIAKFVVHTCLTNGGVSYPPAASGFSMLWQGGVEIPHLPRDNIENPAGGISVSISFKIVDSADPNYYQFDYPGDGTATLSHSLTCMTFRTTKPIGSWGITNLEFNSNWLSNYPVNNGGNWCNTLNNSGLTKPGIVFGVEFNGAGVSAGYDGLIYNSNVSWDQSVRITGGCNYAWGIKYLSKLRPAHPYETFSMCTGTYESSNFYFGSGVDRYYGVNVGLITGSFYLTD